MGRVGFVSIPSNRGGVSYLRLRSTKRCSASCLNPLESGRCFLPLTLQSRAAQGPVDPDPGISPLKSGPTPKKGSKPCLFISNPLKFFNSPKRGMSPLEIAPENLPEASSGNGLRIASPPRGSMDGRHPGISTSPRRECPHEKSFARHHHEEFRRACLSFQVHLRHTRRMEWPHPTGRPFPSQPQGHQSENILQTCFASLAPLR